MVKNGIKVERDTFEYKGKSYFEYFICGNVRGRDVKIKLAPPDNKNDKGGYTVLDIVFGNASKADFVIEPYEFTNAEGKVVSGERYLVRTTDEDGETYECAVKPTRNSDKTLLNMLLR